MRGNFTGAVIGAVAGLTAYSVTERLTHNLFCSLLLGFAVALTALIAVKIRYTILAIIESAKTDTKEARKKLRIRSRILKATQKKLSTTESELRATEGQLHSAQMAEHQLLQKIRENAGEINTAALRLAQANEQIKTLSQANFDQAEQLAIAGVPFGDLQSKLAQQRHEIESLVALLQKTISRLTDQNTKLESKHQLAQIKIARLEARTANLPPVNQGAFFVDQVTFSENTAVKESATPRQNYSLRV